ncbi:MAG: nucleotidyltransferase domain-containing protein [archaeon]
MKLNKFDFSVGEEELREFKKEIKEFMEVLKQRAGAEVFLGGSFAKGTVAKSEEYDADIFVRFDWKYDNLSGRLEKILKPIAKAGKFNMKRMHGSRDYFKIWKDKKLTFEIIPVTKIKNVKMARNVTDLSYFHVNYVKKHLDKGAAKELALAKKFFKANGIYGAESYIHGFSGYGLECLIIHYKSFVKMLKELVKVKGDERVVIDLKKYYKKKNDVFFELNESKLHSPIILIDPTWKERNVLASLNRETFEKFQEVARSFLKKRSESYFHKAEFDESPLRKKARRGEFLHLVIGTSRQEGDIAGTKMKKFSGLLERVFERYFTIVAREFFYPGEGNKSDFYLVLKSKKEVLKVGPPLDKKKDVERFKKANKRSVKKNGAICAKVKVDFFGKEFIRQWAKSKDGRLKLEGMSICQLKVLD